MRFCVTFTPTLMRASPVIWATRPAAQNAAWCQRLEAAGFAVIAAPLMGIRPLVDHASENALKQQLLELDRFDHLIFVSQNAVHYGVAWIQRYWPQWPVRQQVFAVGRKTAEVLAREVPEVHCPGGNMDSDALLMLPQLQQVAGHKVLILRGQGGLPRMGEVLTSRGAQVHYCELYQRVPEELSRAAVHSLQEAAGKGLAVPVFSGETLTLLADRCAEWACAPQTLALVVPGERVAKLADELGFTTQQLAANASEDAMLAALLRLVAH